MPGGILTVVAVKAIENGSWVVYSAVWVDMLLAWAGGYTVRYMSALGALRNLSRCCCLADVPGKERGTLISWSCSTDV